MVLQLAALSGVSLGESLDDLLDTSKSGLNVADEGVDAEWKAIVEAFRQNDLAKARDLSDAFLRANHRTSPYQLLGVQVMLALANAENPAITKDAVLAEKMKLLMSERNTLRSKFAGYQEAVRGAEATINKLTVNRTQPVQVGTAAYRECARCSEIIHQANAAMDAMKPDIDRNKEQVAAIVVGANQNLKRDALKLLDMLIEAGETDAAFAITSVYTRVVGSDLDVAKKQQDVVRLQEDQTKADKIVAAITGEIDPLLAVGKAEEAAARLSVLTAKVEASDQSGSVKKLAAAKLKPITTRVSLANAGEARRRVANAADLAELSKRLEQLESKLETAQESFGTLIRSVEGLSEYNGEFRTESEKNKAVSTIKEKVRSGAVSKEKMDNMIKARSEHRGILREVEIIQAEATGISVVQKGRLANLKVTAQTALDLLDQVIK